MSIADVVLPLARCSTHEGSSLPQRAFRQHHYLAVGTATVVITAIAGTTNGGIPTSAVASKHDVENGT